MTDKNSKVFGLNAPARTYFRHSSKRRHKNKIQGFTLLELLIAMTIMVMLAGSVALSLKSPYEKVRMKSACQRFELLDQRARALAKKRGRPVWIQMNITSNLFSIVSSEEEPTVSVKQTLGTGVKINKAAVPRRSFDNENVMVQVSPNGETCSYAIHFSVGKQNTWLLVAGMTGQMTIASDESHVQKTLAQCSQ